MGKSGSFFLSLWLLSCCLGVIAESEYWVVPAKEDCQHKENCGTLEEYVKTGAFNQSNVVWIFKKGELVLNGTIVPFTNVHNVTLIGSRECEPPAVNNCTIECKGDQVCMFLFVTSHNITIGNLCFVHQDTFDLSPVSENTLRHYLPENESLCYSHSLGFPKSMTHVYFKNCLHDRSWVFIDTVHVTARNVNFTGRNSYWAVVRPNGNYMVLNCQFHKLFLAQSSTSGDPQHYMTVVLRKPPTIPSTFAFLITNSSFNSTNFLPTKDFINSAKNNSRENTNRPKVLMTYPAVHIISDEPLNGWKANITIDKCHFRRCSPFQLTALEDPGLSVTLNAVKANAYFQKVQERLKGMDKNYTLMGSAIQLFLSNHYKLAIEPSKYALYSNQCATNSSSQLSNITIKSSHFASYSSERGCIILFESRITGDCPYHQRVVLQNNSFTTCLTQKFRSVVYAYQHHVYDKSHRYRRKRKPQHGHEKY